MKFEIKNRFNGKVQFTCELEAGIENLSFGLKLGYVVKKVINENENVNLSGADLSRADLSGANLSWTNLSGANLSGANLSGANLSWTNLSEADLSEADLSEADLSEANLSEANLAEADLSEADLARANLFRADLSGANLSEADLSWTNLSEADLSEADLSRADLSRANLSWTNLSGADLFRADLSIIKNDFWAVLIKAIPEISLLEQSIKDGKIDGSTYSGECACLCGTIEKSGRFGEQCDMRDSYRPIEKFFLNIKPNDTPETNQVSAIVMEWLQEFKSYINEAVK